MPTTRIDPALEVLGVLVPVTMLVTLFGYSQQRMRAAWNDERGLSETVQIAIWAGVALLAAVSVAGIIVVVDPQPLHRRRQRHRELAAAMTQRPRTRPTAPPSGRRLARRPRARHQRRRAV